MKPWYLLAVGAAAVVAGVVLSDDDPTPVDPDPTPRDAFDVDATCTKIRIEDSVAAEQFIRDASRRLVKSPTQDAIDLVDAVFRTIAPHCAVLRDDLLFVRQNGNVNEEVLYDFFRNRLGSKTVANARVTFAEPGGIGLGGVLLSWIFSGGTPEPTARRCTRTDFAGMRFVQVMTGGAVDADDVAVHVHLHGRGNTPEQMVKYVKEIDSAARHIILEGPVKFDKGRAWTVSRCADANQTTLAEQMNWTANKLEQALDQVAECFGRNVVLTGFSNGGSLAYAIAARRLSVVDGVIVLAGCLPFVMRGPMNDTIGIHGIDDATVPFASTAAWAEDFGVDWRPIAGGHVTDDAIAIWRDELERRLA